MKYEIKANKRRSFLMFSLSILFVVLGFLPFLGVGLREYRKYVHVFHDVIFIVVIIFFWIHGIDLFEDNTKHQTYTKYFGKRNL